MKTAAPEKKSVKTLKGQLFGAVSMMLVAAIALGTSTYAWFINNRTVEVKDMTLEVSTSTSMLVALGKKAGVDVNGNPTSWTGYKSVLTNGDITGIGTPTPSDPADWVDFLDVDLVPASVTDDNLKLPAPTFFATNNHVSNGYLDEFKQVLSVDEVDNGTTTYGVGQGPVKKLSLRFLSSNALEVYFSNAGIASIADLITPKHALTQAEIDLLSGDTKTKAQAVFNAEEAQAKDIRAALRISVVAKTSGVNVDGTTSNANAYAATEVHTFQFDDGKYHITGAKNNTYYGTVSLPTVGEGDGTYAAISSVDADMHVSASTVLTALVPGHPSETKNANNTLAVVVNGEVTAPNTNKIPLFTLDKDVARDVDVYIWLEGTDSDCLNGISGYRFNLRLPFAGADRPTP